MVHIVSGGRLFARVAAAGKQWRVNGVGLYTNRGKERNFSQPRVIHDCIGVGSE